MLCLNVEARTGFAGEFVVPVNGGGWIESQQPSDEMTERCLLLFCSRVFRFAQMVKAADVTHANAVVIVAKTMRSRLVKLAAFFYGTIQQYKVVVADAAETTSTVPSINVGDGYWTTFRRRRAMNDNFVYLHGKLI